MNYIETEIDGVWLIEPKVFSDDRGYFMEAFKQEEFEKHIARSILFKIMNHALLMESCAVCIIKLVNIAKQS